MSSFRPERASSKPAYSAAISFCTLPSDIRNLIYKEVLVLAHPLFLFQETASRVTSFAPDRPCRWLALMYTNRQIYSEARAVLYGLNRFKLVDTTQRQVDLLQSFLNGIGANASLLCHLCINFPVAENIEGQQGTVRLREDGLQSLKFLQDKCASLTTLEALIHGQNSSLIKKGQDSSEFVREVLSHIDAQLKAIPSLNRFIVRSYSGAPSSSVMELMQERGWVVLLNDQK